MAYTAFANNIYMDPDANGICNLIVGSVINKFGSSMAVGATAEFALTGCAADYFQDPTDNREVKQIVFITSVAAVYDHFVSNIRQIINVLEAIAYADRIQIITTKGFYIEIWMSASEISVVDENGVTLQRRSDIPANLKSGCFPGDSEPAQPLILVTPQVFHSGGSVLYFQDWSFALTKLVRTWTIGSAAPADVTMATKIRNYYVGASFANYSEFEVELVSNRGSGNGLQEDFFEASILGETTYEMDGESLSVNTVFKFINLDVIGNGQYLSTLDYKVTALNSATSVRDLIETKSFPIEFNVTGASDNYTDPKSLSYIHTIGEAMPAPQNLYINIEGSYTLTFSKIFSITGPGFVDQSTKDFYVKATSGKRTVAVYLNNTVEATPIGFRKYGITIKHSSGTIIIPVVISLSESNEIRINPPFLDFEATIGVNEADTKELTIASSLSYTYDVPQWLIFSGALGGNFNGTVRPSASSNFVPGTYTGNIELTSAEGTKTIPVTYKVKGNSFTELLPNKINFTRDQHFVNLATTIVGVYLKVTMDITTYSFTGEETVSQYPLHVPIFNGRAEFHPGEILDSILSSLKDITQFIPTDLESRVEIPFDYYLPTSLNITMEQTAYSGTGVVKTDLLNNLLFVKGTKPINFDNDCGIMFAQYPIRVTRNSYAMINFIKRSGIHTMEIHVNGKKEKTITHDTVQSSMFGMVVGFKDYKEGDLVYIKLENEIGDFYERKFYVFPENKESYHLAWVTEHEQLELLEFTGGYGIDSNYERIENSVYQNLVNIVEVLKTNRKQPLRTNTGWVLKDNHVLIDSLMMAKRAWLFLPNTDYKIALVPQGKKLANYDSDRGTYSYDIDFLINPDNDAKVYPR
tara:strand:+ start:42857 stop:45451 length:2595 start_codon:yes stop_codon:yes gene_type:complete